MLEPPANSVRNLELAGPTLRVCALERASRFEIAEKAIVINPTLQEVAIGAPGINVIRPFSSQTLRRVEVLEAELLVLVDVTLAPPLNGIETNSGWLHHSEITSGARPESGPVLPLWRSQQLDIGVVSLDPGQLPGQINDGLGRRNFSVRVSLWFASAGTDCGIHNQHDFMEIHTQIAGSGHMQKFLENDVDTLYENEPMWPGYTTSVPYCSVEADRFEYPWHRYYAETDCLWMALEFWPK